MTVTIPFLRTPYNYDTREVSKQTAFYSTKKSKTQQSQKDEADINVIVKRFGLTGQLPTNVRMPQYGDFTGISDYQTALNAVKMANEAFMSYPAHIRDRFKNSPEAFVEFCLDPENREEAIKLGLIVEKPKNEPAAEGAIATEVGGNKTVEPVKTA